MDKSDAPCLTEADIRELADDPSFERGMDYYMHDAIQEPVRQGSELRGECHGSRSEPYQVRVLLGERGIVAAHCTCPRGGFCKHIVALLLNYIRRPDAFRDVPPLEAMLASLTRDDLVGLVETMVRREPSLLALVERRASMPAGSSVDVTTLRRQIWRALRHEDLSDAEEDLRDLLRMATYLRAKTGLAQERSTKRYWALWLPATMLRCRPWTGRAPSPLSLTIAWMGWKSASTK
jgi:uncharacterized Zn finger protein